MNNNGWIGVDLDGTLAEYHGWQGEYHIGAPVPKMIKTVKEHLEDGHTVKILTARVCDKDRDLKRMVKEIQDWTEHYLGQRLSVTNEKDYGMIFGYDDRIKQVIPNKGICLEDLLVDLVKHASKRGYQKAISDIAELLKGTHK